MFCFKCGKEIREDAVFCQYCGENQQRAISAISTNHQSISAAKSVSGELDRDALKIHLGNILSLELVTAKYKRELSEVRYRISIIQKEYHYYQRYVYCDNLGWSYYIHLKYDGKYHLAWSKKGGPYDYQNLNNSYFYWFSWSCDSEIKHLRKAKYWDGVREYKDRFFQVYEKFKAEAPSAYQSIVEANGKGIESLQHQSDEITIELSNAELLLEQAYNINIIPSPFRREIHIIYYLHDFLVTSQESFTTALLHCDLDEIKTKLDRIIEQQEAIILQNAVMIAQNNKMIEQQQKHLEQLAKIEENTNQAVQYANIAANNASVCAWFSTANYIETHR